MALIFCDSFDHYATANLLSKWTTISGGTFTVGSYGRFGTNGLLMGPAGYAVPGFYIRKEFSSLAFVATVGCAFYLPDLGLPGGVIGLFSGSTYQVRLYHDTSYPGRLLLTRDGTASLGSMTTLGIGTVPFQAGTWNYVELQVGSFHATTGSVSVRINGVADPGLSVSNVNTNTALSGTASAVFLGTCGQSADTETKFDDIYARDDATFMGDIRVTALFPTGAGSHADFTRGGSDSGANWSQVDEVAPNSDTDLNNSVAVGDIDSFAMGDLGQTAATILGVQTNLWARKTDAGVRSLALFEKSGTTETAGTGVPLTASYTYQRAIAEVNPATGIPYTLAEINALEIGYKLVS